LGGAQSAGASVNDLGQVVGSSSTLDGQTHATLWDAVYGVLDLNDLVLDLAQEWDFLAVATDISNTGFITGYGLTADGFEHAFLLTEVKNIPEPRMLTLLIIGLLSLRLVRDVGDRRSKKFQSRLHG
jgi:probable HAF family extracellular repeat protein